MLDGRSETLSAALTDAIDQLYAAFAPCKLSEHLHGCGVWATLAQEDLLHAKSLNELCPDDLGWFARKSMTTIGTVDDFRHFLPRLLELVAQHGSVGDCESEIVLGKLTYAGWSSWPKFEHDAVEEFLMALWQQVLSIFPREPDADRFLCSIGQAADDLQPYLHEWRFDGEFPALLHLADLIQQNLHQLRKKHALVNAFWQDRQLQMQQVIAWLIEPETARYMEDGFFRYSDAEFAGELSAAVDYLDILAKRIN